MTLQKTNFGLLALFCALIAAIIAGAAFELWQPQFALLAKKKFRQLPQRGNGF